MRDAWLADDTPTPPDTDDGSKGGRTGKDVPPPEEG